MHSIRLRGPWRYEVAERLTGDDSRPRSGKQKMPADWAEILGSDFRGTVRYRRTFHQPTGLDEGQQVWLVIEGVTSIATVTLNNACLAACGPAGKRYEIQHLLSPACDLIIDVTHPVGADGVGGLTGEVRLEIQTVRPRPWTDGVGWVQRV